MKKMQTTVSSSNGQINAYGNDIYLNTTYRGDHLPMSQETVTLTRNFSNEAISFLGTYAVVNDPNNISKFEQEFLAMSPVSTKTWVKKEERTGTYLVSAIVDRRVLTNESQPQQTESKSNSNSVGSVSGGTWIKDGNPLGQKWKYKKDRVFIKYSWVLSKEEWYFIGEDEYMVVGWKVIGGEKYYFKTQIMKMEETAGKMVTEWRKIDGHWYYFKTKEEDKEGNGRYGYMIHGRWREINEKWYYFHDDGIMAENEWITDDSGTYWVDGTGAWDTNKKKNKYDLSYKLDKDEQLFVAVITAESVGEGELAWKVVANVIMNRVGQREWSSLKTPRAVMEKKGQFSCLNNGGSPEYLKAVNYLNNRNGSYKECEKLITTVMPIYHKEVPDITQGAQLYYSPKSMVPPGSAPSWATKYKRIKVNGINSNDFMLYTGERID